MTMPTLQERDTARLEALGNLLIKSSTSPIGDTLSTAINIFEEIEDPITRQIAEEAMCGLRSIASRAQPDDLLFNDTPKLPRDLSDNSGSISCGFGPTSQSN